MKQPAGIPTFFKNLVEEPLNALVEKAQDAGQRSIGYTCSYVPRPLLDVEGIFGVRLRAPGVSGTPMSDTYLSNVICSVTRSIMELALEGAFSSLGGWVFASSCDHMRRLYDNLDYLEPLDFVHILDVPHKRGEAATAWMKEELEMLAEKLAEHFGVDTGKEALARSIKEHNRLLAILRDLDKLRRLDAPPLSGAQYQMLMVAATSSPRDAIIGPLENLYKELASSTDGIDDYRARLLLAGSNCDDPGYIRVIESTGGLVVGDRTCTGSIPALQPVSEEGGDPLLALARHSLDNISCPRMMEEFDARAREILEAVKLTRADGVVLETMKFCDTWGVEASPFVSVLREQGIPVLRLEREYAMSSEGQLQTRVQAFLESMGR
ncbi:MAG: 2-hydroxyacyl-CoA dehydratase family protein [Desulfatibacillaceae bacterium]|nr:2-hydroxyacyl-CoA dehydratase family protein [Desulfatibacillaceae bacterium]